MTKIDYVFPSSELEWDDLKHFIYFMDEPVSVFNYYIFWCLARKAREKVKVTFYAMGGGLFGQYSTVSHYKRYFKELWKRKDFTRLLIELIGALPQVSMSSIGEILNRSDKSEIKRLIAPEFVNNILCEELVKDTLFGSKYLHFLESMSILDHLRVCDRVSSAFSIESRYPLLDHRIVDFSFSLPTTQKLRNGWNKYVLRNALEGLIPESIRKSRKKFGAPIPLERWMKQLRRNIRKIFESSKFRNRGYFNQSEILDAYDRFCEGKFDRFSSTRYAEVFWRILNLELWLETFFDIE
jgi:asparagine synthase (glutamine-hydrolysing)